MAHSSLNVNLFTLFTVNYRKSVTVRKIFKSSSKLDQAEYCKFFRFEMTSKWSWLLCFCRRGVINHQNFPRFPLFYKKYLCKSKKIHEEKKFRKFSSKWRQAEVCNLIHSEVMNKRKGKVRFKGMCENTLSGSKQNWHLYFISL